MAVLGENLTETISRPVKPAGTIFRKIYAKFDRSGAVPVETRRRRLGRASSCNTRKGLSRSTYDCEKRTADKSVGALCHGRAFHKRGTALLAIHPFSCIALIISLAISDAPTLFT